MGKTKIDTCFSDLAMDWEMDIEELTEVQWLSRHPQSYLQYGIGQRPHRTVGGSVQPSDEPDG